MNESREIDSPPRTDSSLLDRVAVVTGASTGIGRTVALELAQRGAIVVVNSRSEDRARLVAEDIERCGGRAVAVAADVRTEGTMLIEQAVRQLSRIDVLVNNAGRGFVGPSVSLDPEEWKDMFDLLLTAPFTCSQAAARYMIPAKRGAIINIGSIAGHVALPQRAAYCAAKAGLIALTKTLAVEWAEHGIRVMSVDPAYISTGFVQRSFQAASVDPSAIERRTPLGRMGTAEEVARVVGFLASDDASYLTGSSVLVDGGWTAYGGW